MNIFYVRVSTVGQHEDRQVISAEEVHADKVFVDKASGKNTERPEFQKMMAFCREGDTVICSDISRIARNTRDLLEIVAELQDKGVQFVSLKENIDTSTPQGKFILTIFAALAELERASILQRQAEGIAIAKENGIYKGRKPKSIDEEKFRAMVAEWQRGERSATSIQKAFGISGTTFYKWISSRGIENEASKRRRR